MSAGRKGAQGRGPQKSLGLVAFGDLCVFGVPWRSRVPVLDLCPFARFPRPLLYGRNDISKSSASTFGQRPRSGGR